MKTKNNAKSEDEVRRGESIDQQQDAITVKYNNYIVSHHKECRVRPKIITLDRFNKVASQGKRQWSIIQNGHLSADDHSVYEVGMFSIKVFSFKEDAWISLSKKGLENVAITSLVVALGDCYVIGLDAIKGGAPKYLYRYNNKQNEWERRADLHQGRFYCGLVVVGRYIYAVGGYDADNDRCLRSLERYDSETNCWAIMPPMPTEYASPIAVSLNHHIYAITGWDETTSKISINCYNTKTQKWRACAEPTHSEEFYGIGAAGKYIYIVSNSVERYDPILDSWTTAPEIELPHRSLTQKYLITW